MPYTLSEASPELLPSDGSDNSDGSNRWTLNFGPDYPAPIYNERAWCRAVEKLMGIDLTPRTKVLRTIAGELGRIQSHLLCVGAAGLDLGAFTAFLYGFNERRSA